MRLQNVYIITRNCPGSTYGRDLSVKGIRRNSCRESIDLQLRYQASGNSVFGIMRDVVSFGSVMRVSDEVWSLMCVQMLGVALLSSCVAVSDVVSSVQIDLERNSLI